MVQRELEIYYRFNPKADYEQLRGVGPKAWLWLHGGKFSPNSLKKLAVSAFGIGLANIALDVGQKTRATDISGKKPLSDHETGITISSGDRVLLTTRPLWEFGGQDGVILANWLPPFDKIKGETGIVFGDKDNLVGAKIDWEHSGGEDLALLVETGGGNIFDDEAFVGRKIFFPENRPGLLTDKDHQLLTTIPQGMINRLIFSFVRNEGDVKEAYEAVDKFWPGWRDKIGNRIVWKLETAGALKNINYFLSLDNCDFMLGLGDLETACKSAGLNFADQIDKVLQKFNNSARKLIVASGMADGGKYLPQQGVGGFGLTYEAVVASQKGKLVELLTEFRKSLRV